MEFVRSVLSERGTVPTLAAQSVSQVVKSEALTKTDLLVSVASLRFEFTV